MKDYLEMSDEEIAGMSAPAPSDEPASEPVVLIEQPAVEEVEADDGEPAVVETPVVPDPADEDEEDANDTDLAAADDKPVVKPDETPVVAPVAPTEPVVELDKDGKPVVAPVVAAVPDKPVVVDFEAGYNQLMAPFKANGKEIKLDSPEEAIKLMQMGANYTRKMQQLAPAMKIVGMLRNNELLDEGKLSFLIDLHKKNPEAIQKLVSDAGIQPMDIDADRAKDYVPGDHRVTDGEMSLQAVMDEVATSPTGSETINIILEQWDADSKQALFNEPSLLAAIDDQRRNGIYDRIQTEVERQRTLGNLQGVPVLQAYMKVGDALHAKGLLGVPTAPAVVPTPVATPIATKVVLPKAPVNGDKARAAAPGRVSNQQTAAGEVDLLSMSDEAFLKQMENRV